MSQSKCIYSRFSNLHGKKLNILLVLNSMEVGGSQTYIITLAEKLKANGHKVAVVSWGGCLVEKLKELNVKHYKLPFCKFVRARAIYFYLRTVRSRLKKSLYFFLSPFFISIFIYSILKMIRIAKKEKIRLIHSNQPVPTSMSFFVSRLMQIPLVTTVHGPGLHEFPPYAYYYLLHVHLNVICGINRIISVSEEIKYYLINKYAVDDKKINVIHNGINLQKFHPGDFEQRASNIKKILFLSGGSHFGASRSLIEATPKILEEVHNCKIMIVGHDFKNRITKLAEKMNEKLAKNVIVVLSAQAHDEIPKLISQSTIVIGVGRSIMEAMACGKAVIVAGTQGFGGIVTLKNIRKLSSCNFSGRGTKVKTTRENMAENITRILKDDKLRASLELFSRKMANDFDSRNVASRIEEIYFDVSGINK